MEKDHIIVTLINRQQVADRLVSKKELLFEKIRSNTYYAIKYLEPPEVLSFYLTKNGKTVRTIRLEASLEYCKLLFHFLKGNNYNGNQIESFVTPKALEAVEKSIVEFYSDDSVIQEFAMGIADEIEGDTLIGKVLRGELDKETEWLKGEVLSLVRNNFGGTISTQMAENFVHHIHVFAQSSAGKALISAISKVLATGAGKMLVSKMAVIVGHAVASSAFHAAIITGVRKVGVTVLVKTAIGKAIIALLALLGVTASIPLVYIILPIIAIIIAYEYNKLPEKLANKVPGEVVAELRPKFTELNEEITKSLLNGVVPTLLSQKAM